MDKFNYKMGTIYQFIVLIAIIFFIGYGLYAKGEWNDILLGALLGVMVSLPFTDKEAKKDERE